MGTVPVFDKMEQLIERHSLTMRLHRVMVNPVLFDPEIPVGAVDHYRCRIAKPDRKMDVYLSVDSDGDRLTLSDVLMLLAIDASGCKMLAGYEAASEQSDAFLDGPEDIADEFERFWNEYRNRCRQTERLRKFLGDHAYRELVEEFQM